MAAPEIQTIAISNVFCRCMNFKTAGDIEEGHCHTYDHGTLIANGQILLEMLDENDNVIGSKKFTAPALAFIRKDRRHRLTALVDGSTAVCIHALREINEDIIPSDALIEEKWFADKWSDSEFIDDHIHTFFHRHHDIRIMAMSLPKKDDKPK